jgi:hypothetical protein
MEIRPREHRVVVDRAGVGCVAQRLEQRAGATQEGSLTMTLRGSGQGRATGSADRSSARSPRAPLASFAVAEQGSFLFGGTVITGPNGDTMHADHGYAQFQVPPDARELPLVMWHGGFQSAKTWESTPDGREGYQTIFVRRGFAVYLVDQPRRARGGGSAVGITIPDAIPNDSFVFTTFRWGTWTPPEPPSFFPGVQIARDPVSIDQYLRQAVTNTGPAELDVTPVPVAPDAGAALFERVGPSVLLTHSAGGYVGWLVALQSTNVRAVVAYEPARFVFPEGEAPAAASIPGGGGAVFSPGIEVPRAAFATLTRIPIQVVYGDNIPTEPSDDPAQERWRARLAYSREFVEAVKRHGGDAQLVHLPEAGLVGNTHFPFSDLNNIKVADLLSEWLHDKGLDRRRHAPRPAIRGGR